MEFRSNFRKMSSQLGGNILILSVKGTSLLSRIKVHSAAAAVQVLYAGFQVFASAALSDGVSRVVFPVYRNAIAALMIAPFAFFFERGRRPPLTLFKTLQFFLSGLIGVGINQTLFLAGLYYTSATFASTVQNLTPAITFALAASLGIEKIRIRRIEGQAKALGILVCVGGATLIALYKGPSLVEYDGLLLRSLITSDSVLRIDPSSFVSWQIGALCLIGNCATWAIWFVLQAPIMRDYPAPISAISFTYGFGTIQLAIVAVCIERDPAVWASTFLSDLPAVLYGGIVASGLAMTLQGWCAHRGGPVVVAAYQPLQTILVAILSSIFLAETFYLGSLLGGLLIISGLYLVVWGKSREGQLEATAKVVAYGPGVLSSTGVQAAALVEPLLNTESSSGSDNEP